MMDEKALAQVVVFYICFLPTFVFFLLKFGRAVFFFFFFAKHKRRKLQIAHAQTKKAMKETPLIKARTRREIANLLGMEEHTFARKLKENGITLPKGLVAPQWQKVIFDTFWYPPGYGRKDFDSFR